MKRKGPERVALGYLVRSLPFCREKIQKVSLIVDGAARNTVHDRVDRIPRFVLGVLSGRRCVLESRINPATAQLESVVASSAPYLVHDKLAKTLIRECSYDICNL